MWYARLLEDAAFRRLLSERWTLHRSGPWADAALLGDIDSTADLLTDAQERNFGRWDVLGEYVWPNDEGAVERHSYAEEVDYLKTWLMARTAWMDTQLLE